MQYELQYCKADFRETLLDSYKDTDRYRTSCNNSLDIEMNRARLNRVTSFESSEYLMSEEESPIIRMTDSDSFFKAKNGISTEDETESQSFFAPGSINTSVFTLVAATAGAGTITMPYVICVSGIGLGMSLIVIGACLSHYTGNLLVS